MSRPCLAVVLALAACGHPHSSSTSDSGVRSPGDATGRDAAPSCQAGAADFYVATDGNDAWSGTLAAPSSSQTDGPFATLAAAQAAVRKVPRANRTTPITVLVRGGTYVQHATWTLDATDSGTATVPVIYAAYGCETPVISGGIAISSWTTGANGTLTAQLPSGTSFSQLWVNGVRRFRPRANGGAYGSIDTPTASGFHYTNATAFSPSWHDLAAVEVVVFEDWTMSRMHVVSVDATTQTVTTDAFTDETGTHPTHGYIQNHRYLVENVREAIQPGEFYLDRATAVLTYQPMAGETAQNVTAIAPVLNQVVAANSLAYTTFRGLTFSHSSFVVPAGGYQAGQAMWNIPGAVLVQGSAHVVFDGCTFSHLGNIGLELQGAGNFIATTSDPYAIEVVNSAFSDIGVNALRIGSVHTGQLTDANTVQYVHVANDVFSGGGRFMAGGMGIVVGESHHDVIDHNEISDFYQTAISVGFTFAQQTTPGAIATYPTSLAHDDIISNNLIHDIGRGVTSDLGGIYLLTSSASGNRVTGNVIHDVVNTPSTGGYGANGIYFDEGTSNVLTENNLVYRCSDALMQQNEGRANTFQNNIFAYGRAGVFHHHYYEPPTVLWATFTHNIVVYDHAAVFLDDGWYCPTTGTDCRSSFDFHDNDELDASGTLSFTTQAPAKTFSLATFQSMESEELGSIANDPMFANPSFGHDDFTLPATSPAFTIGFAAFETASAGRTNPVLMPPAAPAAFPLAEPADPSTFY